MSRYLLLSGEAFRLGFQLAPRYAFDLELPQFRGEFAPLSYRRLPHVQGLSNSALRPEILDDILSSHPPIIGIPISAVNRQPDLIKRHHSRMARTKRLPVPGSVGERIRKARERLRPRLTQAALAKLAGVEQSSISELETGETKEISGPTLIALAVALRVHPEWLLKNVPPMESGDAPAVLEGELQEVADLWEYVPPSVRAEMLDRFRQEAAPALDKARQVFEKHGVKGYAPNQRVKEAYSRKKETVK